MTLITPCVCNRQRHACCSGFTLIELMVTVVILAILLGIAAPSFQNIITNQRVSAYANELLSSAMLARSEALKNNQTVVLCASSSGTGCVGTWTDGWIVIRDTTVLKRQEALASGFLISGDETSISFPGSSIGVTSATLTVCRSSPVGASERVVSISSTGRASVAKTTTGTCS